MIPLCFTKLKITVYFPKYKNEYWVMTGTKYKYEKDSTLSPTALSLFQSSN